MSGMGAGKSGAAARVGLARASATQFTDEVLREILLLAERDVPLSVIAQWTSEEKNLACQWASLTHLSASDNPVRLIDEPWLVKVAAAPVPRRDTPLARKGDQAEIALRGPRDPALAVAMDDLVALEAYGALSGVAEVLRERRIQVAEKGHTVESDDEHEGLELITEASNCLASIGDDSGWPEYEKAYREAGALLAAEIDRLGRMLSQDGTT